MTKFISISLVVCILGGAYYFELKLRSEYEADDYQIARSLISDGLNNEAVEFIRSSELMSEPKFLNELLLYATGRTEMVVGAPIQHERYPFLADAQIMEFLISAGANTNYKRTPHGGTALVNAIYHDDVRTVIRLLELGACPDSREIGGSLYLARLHEHVEIENLLLWFNAFDTRC